jgi:plasmid rolling circle replication initiator protein Rep
LGTFNLVKINWLIVELIERKLQVDKIAFLYEQLGYDSYANRMRQCARFARFVEKTFWVPEYDDYDQNQLTDVYESEPQYLLNDAIFCRVRLCPICQWRKSKRWQALALKNLPSIQEQHSGYRWLFLTLTIKNCKLSRLRGKVSQLNKSFLKWVKWKSFPADGWIKSLEVTLDESDPTLCHPHFHILLMVPGDYFNNKEQYLTQPDWVYAWRKAAKLSYDPVVDIRAVRQGKEEQIIPELLKYGVKPDDLAGVSSQQLKLLTNQLHSIHAINKGGLLRSCFKNVGSDNVDLIGSGHEGMPTGYQLYFVWQQSYKSYVENLYKDKELVGSLIIDQDVLNSDHELFYT